MTREEKIRLAIEKGITCNPSTGQVFGIRGKEITKNHNGYIRICLRNGKDQINIHSHQFIWYWVNKEVVDCIDHINGIRDDNRIQNLRSISQQQNMFNQSNVKGYTWSKLSNKWQSYIKVNQKPIHLGYFDNEVDAHNAYLNAKKIYHII